MVKCVLLSLLGLFYTIKVTYLGEYVPTAEEIADPILYGENVREVYYQHLGWDKVSYTYKDKAWFLRKKNAQYSDCSEAYKDHFAESQKYTNFFLQER